ncbi:hypothetical protein DFH09DRAFT_1101038 [Mycena vulgaris]|nr:hypothetical protein DFH09DRAFT_1101038 [Mycena vulgaris]
MSGEIIPLAEEAFDLMGKNFDCAGETDLFIFNSYAYASLLIDHVTIRTDALFGRLQKSDGRPLEGRSSRSQAVGLEETQLNSDDNSLSPNSGRDPYGVSCGESVHIKSNQNTNFELTGSKRNH